MASFHRTLPYWRNNAIPAGSGIDESLLAIHYGSRIRVVAVPETEKEFN